MKKLITTCVLLTSITMVSFAQAKTSKTSGKVTETSTAKATATTRTLTPEQQAEKHAKTIQSTYGLNENQYQAIYQADVAYYTQTKSINETGGPAANPGQTQQMNVGRDQRYQNVMTPDQFAKYQAAATK